MSRRDNSRLGGERGAGGEDSIVDSLLNQLDSQLGSSLPKRTSRMGAAESKETTKNRELSSFQYGGPHNQTNNPAVHPRIDPASMAGNARIAALMSEAHGRSKGACNMQAPSTTAPSGPKSPHAPHGHRGPRGVIEVPSSPDEGADHGARHRGHRYARSLPSQAAIAPGSGEKTEEGKESDTKLLTQECQKRHFNPHFIERVTNDGYYTCSVDIRGRLIRGAREYESAAEAKAVIAQHALSIVRRMSCGDGVKKPSDNIAGAAPVGSQDFADGKRRPGGPPGRHPKEYYRRRQANMNRRRQAEADRRYAEASHYEPDYRDNYKGRYDEERSIIERIHSLNPPSNRPRERILSDPVASQAFLEGFSMGARMADAMHGHPDAHDYPMSGRHLAERSWWDSAANRRERSPVPHPSERVRERSPLRRQDRSGTRVPEYPARQRSRVRQGRSPAALSDRFGEEERYRLYGRDVFSGK
ncbi:hypothetical protein F5Y13DRAFT_187579 [Hypoxylon sp. FL1857]|nr:hypothetical protein F5Y13DRAFT_187579 [Hypoxylon sp. FL1857]